MIKLYKRQKPQVLVDNAAKWTAEYLNYINNGITQSDKVSNRYNKPEIKNALEKETHGKCAYCESKIKHIEYGDIEHIIPKNKNSRPDLYVEWDNLTLACEVCNRNNIKDYYDTQLPLINPYVDDPDEYFIFVGTIITAKENNQRAYITESTLDLNRSELVIRRNERLTSINHLLFAWSQADDGPIKDILTQELIKECSEDKEYSAIVKHFLVSKGFPAELLTN